MMPDNERCFEAVGNGGSAAGYEPEVHGFGAEVGDGIGDHLADDRATYAETGEGRLQKGIAW
jgi:hypothetical protein